MLTIRLSRVGKKNMPLYRLIISEKTKDLVGDSLEILGSYNPHSKELVVKEERIKYWISKGASMSATVNNILAGKKILAIEKVKVDVVRAKRKEKK
jgi:small subunit ribosomal protein S16